MSDERHPLDMPLHRVTPYGPDTDVPPPRKTRGEVALEVVKAVPNLAKLCARLVRDPRVPRKTKWLLGFTAAYVVSPVDLVPELLFPVVGRVDDLVLLAFSLHRLLDAVEPDVLREHWDGEEDALELVTAFVAWAGELLPSPLRRALDR